MRRAITIVAILGGGALGAWSAGDADAFVVAFCAAFWAVAAWLVVGFVVLLRGKAGRAPPEHELTPEDWHCMDALHPAPRTSGMIELEDDDLSLEQKRFLHHEGW